VETGDWFHLLKYKWNQIWFELLHSHGKLADYVFGNIPTGIILPHSLYRSEDHGCLSCTTQIDQKLNLLPFFSTLALSSLLLSSAPILTRFFSVLGGLAGYRCAPPR
jgi:hypothetical protein